MQEDKDKKLPHKKVQQYNNFMAYTALSTEMIGMILFCTWVGYQLDAWMGNRKPWALIGCVLFGVFGSMWLLWKRLMALQSRKSDKNDKNEKNS